MERPRRIVPVIIFSQFAATSLWFAGNAVIDDLTQDWGLDEGSLGLVTSSVQIGFIIGTLVSAIAVLVDRFSPRVIFFTAVVSAAVSTLAVVFSPHSLLALLILRFATGFFLAGVYPVGMTIAAGWHDGGLGRALGYLVGALVAGTAFPHLLRASGTDLDWRWVLISVSLLAAAGGIAMLVAVPDGPFLSTGSSFEWSAVPQIFRSVEFRSSAFGYFGHMWELYAFWAFLPWWLGRFNEIHGLSGAVGDVLVDVSAWSFIVIVAGAVGCAVGGVLSDRFGSRAVAGGQLAVSGLCCAISPWLFGWGRTTLLTILVIWGITVVGDSPQYSALNARFAPPAYVGTALTIVTSIGFAITVVSIQLVDLAADHLDPRYLFWLLLPGPILGLMSLFGKRLGRPSHTLTS